MRNSANQKGFAHILGILLLAAGLGVTVYLVKTQTNIFPKAYEAPQVNSLRTKVTPSPQSSPTPSSTVACNSKDISLTTIKTSEGKTTFNITGDASTWIADDYSGGVSNDCVGTWDNRTCNPISNGTYKWTHYWKHCEGSFDNCSDTCSLSTTYKIDSVPKPNRQVACNTNEISLSTAKTAEGKIAFKISGDASTWVTDNYGGGVNAGCIGTWDEKICDPLSAGSYKWTHYWRHCEGSFDNCSSLCSISANYSL